MRRFKFYVSAILMVGFLGTAAVSCVDDKESASVTELRGAKAEALKAQATLDKSRAEAALIDAKALELLNKAMADKAVAETKILEAKSAEDRELAKVELARVNETFKVELKALELRTDSLNMAMDAQKMSMANELVRLQNKAKEDNNAELYRLIGVYESTYNNLSWKKRDISDAERNNITYAWNIANRQTDAEATAANKKTQEDNIAVANANIVNYEAEKAILVRLESHFSSAALQTEITALKATIATTNEAKIKAYEAKLAANNAKTVAKTNLEEFTNTYSAWWSTVSIDGVWTYVPKTLAQLNVDLKDSEKYLLTYKKYEDRYIDSVAKFDGLVETLYKAKEDSLADRDAKQKLVDLAQIANDLAYAKHQADPGSATLLTAYNTANTALNTANTALSTAQTKYYNASNRYSTNDNKLNNFQAMLANAKTNLAFETKNVQDLKDGIANYTALATNFQKLQDLVIAADKVVTAKDGEFKKVKKTLESQELQLTALNSYFGVDGGSVDGFTSQTQKQLLAAIAVIDANIVNENEKITKAERLMTSYVNTDTAKAYWENELKLNEAQIADWKLLVTRLEAELAAAKKAIDAHVTL